MASHKSRKKTKNRSYRVVNDGAETKRPAPPGERERSSKKNQENIAEESEDEKI